MSTQDQPTDKTTEESAEQRQLPLFYKDIHVLNAETHENISYKPKNRFAFAKSARIIPVNLNEMVHAARFYPIVFSKISPAVPLAVVGMRDDENLFIDPMSDTWEKETYIPAYIRRYPFIFASDGSSEQKRAVCIDHNEDFINQGKESPLMVDGKPSEVVENAIKFCQNYESSAQLTATFTKALEDKGLLDERQASIPAGQNNEQGVRVAGFRVINLEKLGELDGATLEDWNRKGFLTGVYGHIFSTANWSSLMQRLKARQGIQSMPTEGNA